MMIHDQGLSTQEVQESRLKYGSNELTAPPRESLWRKFLEKFEDPIIIILLVAMCLSIGVSCFHYFGQGDSASVFLEPIGVLMAVLLATGIAFYFELKSEREFEVLNQVNDEIYYKVYRDGMLMQILKAELVVGDLVLLEAGEEVPADGRLIEAISMSLDESSLTGEPYVMKTTDQDLFDEEATYPSDYICRGSIVVDGHGVYRIERVGDATEYGKIFKGVHVDNSIETPLNKQLNRLAETITWVSYGIAALILLASIVLYFYQGHHQPVDWAFTLEYFLNKIMIAITVVVVAVPEGLPMSVTLSLAYSMRSMMKTGNLVRRMHACETMGAATVICTDKTGTLTENRMSIAQMALEEHALPDYKTLLYLSMAVNSTAHLDRSEGERHLVLGNPTEGALLLWLETEGQDYLALRESNEVEAQLTFSTERKYMATVIRFAGKRLLLVKGAPEVVMHFSHLTDERRAYYEERLKAYQNKAYRTIALACAWLEEQEEAWRESIVLRSDMVFMGVVAISDPIRRDVPEAVQTCMSAGLQVKIVTGDVSGTAREIGRQIGLWDDSCHDERNLITGAEFAALSDDDLRPRLQDIRIMSRARPMDKERLVRLLQEAGEVVAVTGDGTNDAPALKRAQVGLSMGDGTAVAKEASDITILDNSFASIVHAVMWGRSLYLNIQRFILFQMTINVAACLTVLLGAVLGVESPLTVTQMLWVNLIMDTFAALALASLPPSREVMKEKPRKQSANIIAPDMARRIIGVGIGFTIILLGLVQYFKHYDLQHIADFNLRDSVQSLLNFTDVPLGLSVYELTIIFCIFVFLQFWNMFNAKAYRAKGSAFSGLRKCTNFLFIAVFILIGQVLITSLGGEMFRVVPLDLESWVICFVVTSIVLGLGELGRWLKAHTIA